MKITFGEYKKPLQEVLQKKNDHQLVEIVKGEAVIDQDINLSEEIYHFTFYQLFWEFPISD